MELWSWGANSKGQLSLGFKSEQEVDPKKVPIRSHSDEVRIVGGGTFVLWSTKRSLQVFGDFSIVIPQEKSEFSLKNDVLHCEDEILSIGAGWDFIILSLPEKSYCFRSRLPPVLLAQGDKLTQVAAGLRHAAGVNTNGKLLLFGDNTKSQLGVGARSFPSLAPSTLTGRTRAVRCGQNFTLVLQEDGQLFGSGCSKWGQLMRKSTILDFSHIGEVGDIKDFGCGWSHVVVLLRDGRLLSWGRNDMGQLGRETISSFDPQPGEITLPEPISAVAVGSEHSLAIGQSGRVWAWGWNEHGSCGIHPSSPATEFLRVPVQVNLSGECVEIFVGGASSFALLHDRKENPM